MNANSLIAGPATISAEPPSPIVEPDVGHFGPGGPNRVLASPVRPFILYTREMLVAMGVMPADTPAGGGAGQGGARMLAPARYFGKRATLPRIPRVMVVVSQELQADDPPLAAAVAARYAAALEPLGVHVFLTGGIYNFPIGAASAYPRRDAPFAGVAPVTGQELRSVGTVGDIHFKQWFYDSLPADGMRGGEVFWCGVSTDPYGLIQTQRVLTSQTVSLRGYAVYDEQTRLFNLGPPFTDYDIDGWEEYARHQDPDPGTTGDPYTRIRVLRNAAQADADRAVMLAYAARCRRFRFTFFTGDYAVRGSGDPVPGDPDGLVELLAGGSDLIRRSVIPTTPDGNANVLDVEAAADTLVAAAVQFFSGS